MSVARDHGFDFPGRVAVNLQTMLRRRQQDHAAHFRQPQGRSHVQRRKDIFHRHDVRRKFFDQPAYQLMDFLEDGRLPILVAPNGSSEGAIMYHSALPPNALYNSVACGTGRRWVNS